MSPLLTDLSLSGNFVPVVALLLSLVLAVMILVKIALDDIRFGTIHLGYVALLFLLGLLFLFSQHMILTGKETSFANALGAFSKSSLLKHGLVSLVIVSLLLLAIQLTYRLIGGRWGMGDGDIWLAAASALWIKPWQVPLFLTLIGAFGLLIFAYQHGVLQRSKVLRLRQQSTSKSNPSITPRSIPLAPAIALATVSLVMFNMFRFLQT